MHLLPLPGRARMRRLSVEHRRRRRDAHFQEPRPAMSEHLTYLPLRNSLLPVSVIISKAAEAAFYGDPCFSGQFRGALVIALQPARRAPQQRRTPCLNGGEAVWAISAGRGAPAALFDISGGVLRARLTAEERNDERGGVEDRGGPTYHGAAA